MHSVEELKEDVETSDKPTRATIKFFKKRKKKRSKGLQIYIFSIYIGKGEKFIVKLGSEPI